MFSDSWVDKKEIFYKFSSVKPSDIDIYMLRMHNFISTDSVFRFKVMLRYEMRSLPLSNVQISAFF